MTKLKSQTTLPLTELRSENSQKGERAFATEVPLALTYNGVSHVVMMVTPSDLEDFVIGFSLSEEIIATPDEISGLEIISTDNGFIAKIDISKARFEVLINRGRNLVGQSGCGICGVAELEDAVRTYPKIKTKPKIDKKTLFKALALIENHQPLNRETGAVHGAGFANWRGNMQVFREDVGRHNAFDKLIGHMAGAAMDFTSGFAILTSRGSFELVQKALSVGIPMLVTVSAPTDLAITLARDHDLTLVALARADSMLAVNDPFNLFL